MEICHPGYCLLVSAWRQYDVMLICGSAGMAWEWWCRFRYWIGVCGIWW